jgi:hypothetical protein
MIRHYFPKVCFPGYWPEHAILDGTWRPLRDREAEEILRSNQNKQETLS